VIAVVKSFFKEPGIQRLDKQKAGHGSLEEAGERRKEGDGLS
jgi:hypothetical protein